MNKQYGNITKCDYEKNTLEGRLYVKQPAEVILKNKNIILDKQVGEKKFEFKNIEFSKLLMPEVLVEGQKVYSSNSTILLARQRTGTNVLRKFLNTHSDIFSINEIFDPGIYNNKAFSHYDEMYKQLINQNSDLIGAFFPFHFKCISELQKPLSYKQTFQYFLDYINIFCTAKHNIIDIKYNHLHNLTEYIEPILSKNISIFDIIKQRNLKVINLVRKNYLKSFVSGQLASKTGNYVLNKHSSEDKHEKMQVDIDVNQLLYAMNIIKQEDDLIYLNLKDYENYIKIEYADMFNEEGEFTDNITEKFSSFFNVSNSFDTTPMLKKLQNRELEDIIKNYDEVKKAVMSTDFAYCLD